MKKNLSLLFVFLCLGTLGFAQKSGPAASTAFTGNPTAARLACVPINTTNGFIGDLDPANWVLTLPSDGSFVPSGDMMTITGPNGGVGSVNTLCITAPYNMEISLDWAFDNQDVVAANYDFFGYSTTASGGVELAGDDDSGSITVELLAGEEFCFVTESLDGLDGPGVTTITNFTYSECDAGPVAITLVPTMSEWGLFLFGLGMVTLGLVFVYNKQRQLA